MSEPPAAAEEAPAGVEDLPAEAPAPADIDAQPVFAGKAITEPDTPADVLQQDAQPAESTVTEPQIPAAAGEPPAAQPEPAAADSQKIWIDTSQDDARTLPEPSPGPAAAAGDLAVQQAGAGPARQQTGAGRQKKGVVLIKVGTQWVEVPLLHPTSLSIHAHSKSNPAGCGGLCCSDKSQQYLCSCSKVVVLHMRRNVLPGCMTAVHLCACRKISSPAHAEERVARMSDSRAPLCTCSKKSCGRARWRRWRSA